jgi:hypothetical protein
MPLTRAALISAIVLVGCAGAPGSPPPCLTDDDCAGGNVCFPDGCGDPTRGLAVEILGGSTVGLFPQDFEVPQLGTTQNFDIKGPLSIVGSFQRERTAGVDPTQRSIYTDEVLVRATGESVVLPGIARSYQQRFSMTDRGTFSMNVGQGKYTVSAFPTNLEVPPQTFPNVSVSPDAGPTVNFAFASVEGAITLPGRLIKKKVLFPTPSELYITQAAMDLQAIDPATGEPLSQRIETSTGRPGTRGDFILVVSPKAKTLARIELVATPREVGASVPSRRFPLTPPFPSALTLELGDFGEEVKDVPGLVLGPDGQPLEGATVVIEGTVGGGGTFRSKTALTDAKGAYKLDLLPPEGAFTLTVFPRAGSRPGLTQQSVKLENAPGAPPVLDPPSVRCIERIPVSGQVLLPDGNPAVMLAVRAIETGTGKRPLPLEDVDVLTDVDGKYSLFLDPGSWRIEFTPLGELPATSRLVTVSAAAATMGGMLTGQTFAPITLPRGRRLTGLVTSSLSNRGSAPLVNAQVRFFRVTTIEGKPASVLLGAGVTNGVGSYTVILPTRESARQQ